MVSKASGKSCPLAYKPVFGYTKFHMAETAVIKTGGKQYMVSPGKKIKVEKLLEKEGSEVEFSEVLLLENEKGLVIGAPFVEGAKVKGKLLEHGKGEKLVIFKFKAKKRERRKKGHRQPYSQVEITSIEST
jgi:large subunit ribosomal protein L21